MAGGVGYYLRPYRTVGMEAPVATRPRPHEKDRANGAQSRLLGSALRLFAEKGYDGTSIREIIEGAGVTRPVLYYYFENKEALFRHLVESQFERLTARIDAITASYSRCRDRLLALMKSDFEEAEVAPEIVCLVLQAFFVPQGKGHGIDTTALAYGRIRSIAGVMGAGMASGELAPGDPWSMALAFAGVMDMYVMAKSHRPRGRLTAALAAALVGLFMDGAAHAGGLGAFPFPESNELGADDEKE